MLIRFSEPARSGANYPGKSISESLYLFDRVVVHQRRPHSATFLSEAQSLHQARRIHVAVAYPNILFRKLIGDFSRRDTGKPDPSRGRVTAGRFAEFL